MCCCPFYVGDLLRAMDQETMRTLAMQRVQQLILNPESRSLTVFPLPGMLSSVNSSQTTAIPQPWLHSSSASDSGNSTLLLFNRPLLFQPLYHPNRQ